MTAPMTPSDSSADIAAMLDPREIRRLLCENVPFTSAGAPMPCEIRVERVWPAGHDGYVFEWSFDLGTSARYSVFGVKPGFALPDGASDAACDLRMGEGGLRGICVQVPERELTIHTPDFDPKMPHMQECLDPAAMAERLLPVLVRDGRQSTWASRKIDCELLAYRVGRRAAIRYRCGDRDRVAGTLVGKTFRDARGARLISLHDRVNAELGLHTGGTVRVPSPVTYLGDVNLALFSSAPGREAAATLPALSRDASTAMDALTALHGVWLDGLPSFTADGECTVIQRWHGVLQRLDGQVARRTEPLLEGLLRLAKTADGDTPCTIHRDFYEKQLLLTARTTTILDLDTIATGSPCVDIGNFLAHLLLETVRARGSVREFSTLKALLIARYEQRGRRLDQQALRFYLASALFRVGAVHARRTATGGCADTLWAYASDVLSEDEAGGRRAAM